jgi:membrane protease YdiL (CAAX protease family)
VEEDIMQKKGISILGALGIAAMIFLLQIILSIPFQVINVILLELGFSKILLYINVASDILINIVIIFIFVKIFRRNQEFKFKVKYKPSIKECLCVLLFLGAHLLIFSNTIGILIEKIEVSKWVVEAFDKILIDPVIAFMSLCVTAPVFEELIYRGIILEKLSKRYNMGVSIVVSAVIFGLIHANLHQGVNAFFIGLILGFIYIKTNSLLLCMFGHFANNFLGFISFMVVSDNVTDTVLEFSMAQFVLGIILLIVSYRFFNAREDVLELSVSDV